MGTNKKNLAFKVSANNKVGLGHLIRCIKIAKHIKKKYNLIFLVEKNFNINLKKYIKFEFKIVKSKFHNKNLKLLQKEIDDNNIHTLIVDDYNFNYSNQKKIKKKLSKLIIIDDSIYRRVNCTYYINYKHNSSTIIKKNLNKNKSTFKKALLGENFWIPSNYLNNKVKKKKNCISISFGNSFNFNILKKELTYLIQNNTNCTYQIFIGYYCKNYDFLINLNKYNNIKIIQNKIFIDKYLNKTSVFIGSSGNSIYEMSYLNIPSIFLSLSKNQRNDLKNLEYLGHYFYLNKKELDKYNFSNLLKLITENYNRFKALNKNKKIYLNKYGIKKIIKECSL